MLSLALERAAAPVRIRKSVLYRWWRTVRTCCQMDSYRTGEITLAKAVQSGWRPAAGAAARGEDIGLSPLDPHDRAEAGWNVGRSRPQADASPNYGEPGAALLSCGCRLAWQLRRKHATRSCP